MMTHWSSRRAGPPTRRLVSQGWTDAIRELHGDERIYTFWHYLRNRWQRNAGLRLDHLLLSPAIASGLKDAGVDRAIRGREGASDHAPAWIVIERPTIRHGLGPQTRK